MGVYATFINLLHLKLLFVIISIIIIKQFYKKNDC